MSLTSANLVGYLRAEFAKASRLRVWLFFLQLAAAVPAAVAVLIPDRYGDALYWLAFAGAVLLVAWWFLNGHYARIRTLEPLQPGYSLHFKAVNNVGGPFDPSAYKIMWRVTNTDEAAARDNALRGRFEKPESDNSRWEDLKYRGVHLVEAFVIRKRDDKIVGRSQAYRVMIE